MPDELSIDSKTLIFATLADVYLTSGMIDEAISILKDGLARNPNYTLAKIILGRAYFMKGEIEQALKVLEAIYDEAQDSENENLYLAHCYKRQSRFDLARRHYEAVLRINPENKEAQKELNNLAAIAAPAEPVAPPAAAPAPVAIDLKAQPEPVLIKEIELTETPVPAVAPTVEPEIAVQEAPVKINIPIMTPETISKEEREISLNEPEAPAQDMTGAVEEAMKVASVPAAEAPVKPEVPAPVETTPAVEEPIKPEMPAPTETLPMAEAPVKTEIPAPAEKPSPAEIAPAVEPVSDKTPLSEPPPLFEEEMAPAAAVESRETPFDRLEEPMRKLLALKTVTAAFIAATDGLLIKNYSAERTDAEEISALIAAVFNEATESFRYLNVGAMEKCVIEKENETVCVIAAGDSLLCVITQPEAKPGLVFVYARKIIDEIREVLG